MVGLYIFLAILALVIDLIIAGLFSDIAKKKGDNGVLVFWLCLLFAPLGYIYVIALPDMTAQKNQKTLIDLLKSQRVEKIVHHEKQNDQQRTQVPDTATSMSNSTSASSQNTTVEASTHVTLCPQCNKTMTISSETSEIICGACGYKAPLSKEPEYNKESTIQSTHYWMCDKCGKKRSKTPCEYCGNE